MKIYYFWDAYCSWCYGFDSIFEKFLKNHPEIEFEMLSGGLFVKDRVKAVSNYPNFKESYKDVEDFYNVEFGLGYKNMLLEGKLVLNSVYPAIALAVLRRELK